MKKFYLFSIAAALLVLGGLRAYADDAASSEVPVNDEPAASDAVVTGNSSADRSPAGWYTDPDDSNAPDENVAGL